MSRLSKKGITFLERGMQRVRKKLDRLQQDPTQTPYTSITGRRPKWLVDPQNYHDREKATIQANHEMTFA